MAYETLTKFDIAERQLLHAIDHYLAGDLICAITLAGAAEEILGKLLTQAGRSHALESAVLDLCQLFEAVFKQPADQKAFRELRTGARNALKHIGSGDAVEFDFQEEAVTILVRAIKNYQGLEWRRKPKFREFEMERVRRYRALTEREA